MYLRQDLSSSVSPVKEIKDFFRRNVVFHNIMVRKEFIRYRLENKRY